VYAHVNVWSMDDAGARWDDSAAREIGAALQAQPGFVAYTVVRTGEWEVVAVSVFDTERALEAAIEAVTPTVRERLAPLAIEVRHRYEGRVLYHLPLVRPAAA
jgi:heme-degrading monooxygenase HmoA